MKKFIIVGSGLASAAAAMELCRNGIKPVVIDVGYKCDDNIEIRENFYDYRVNNDIFNLAVGKNFTGFLKNEIDNEFNVKLRSPLFEYITRNVSNEENRFKDCIFYSTKAYGGLANTWGAGMIRFNDYDLEKFPFKINELEKYYEYIEKEIGICGENDDLTCYFNYSDNLLPSPELSYKFKNILNKYKKNKIKLNKSGFYLGKPRLGVKIQSDDNGNLPFYNYEFWIPNLNYIYSPSQTFDELIASGKIIFKPNKNVIKWGLEGNIVRIYYNDIITGGLLSETCDYLLIGAGVLNTTKIVLKSFNDYNTKLKVYDNPAILIPLISLKSLGIPIEKDYFGLTQLSFIYSPSQNNNYCVGSMLEVTSPLRTELLKSMPFPVKQSIQLQKYLLPSMLIAQMFYKSQNDYYAEIKLTDKDNLLLDKKGNYVIDENEISELLSYLRKLGLFSSSKIIKHVKLGNSIHYGCVFPMKAKPVDKYDTDKYGRFQNNNKVSIIDPSTFPEIPPKNHGLTIMANSMRIISGILKENNV